jgi:endonuclease/exonuclease/phosphatase family metal-dependent hydrolase
MLKHYLLVLLLFVSQVFGQEQAKIMTYNILNYPGSDSNIRNPEFVKIIDAIQPDILVVQEVLSQAGVDEFLSDVLGTSFYDAGSFIDGTDTDNAIYFNDSLFSFLSNTAISTALRDINQFKLVHNITLDTLYIYSLHLKASQGSDNEAKRLAEVNNLRAVTDNLPENSYFIVLGDFNIYVSSEAAYQRLLEQTDDGYVIDPINSPGDWHNNASFSSIHTQSPRVTQFGGGANGGMDDRFDMILLSQSIMNVGNVDYVSSSYVTYGNDGNHFNLAINVQPNTAVTPTIADALHNASDHIPVYLTLQFEDIVPVELVSFTAKQIDEGILLKWETATEINNYGYEIERAVVNKMSSWEKISLVPGNGTCNCPHSYDYIDKNVSIGNEYRYRLKQIDTDGSYEYLHEVSVIYCGELKFSLHQNYPNPFNPTTVIKYSVPQSTFVSLKVYNIIGEQVAILVNKYKVAGSYEVNFDGDELESSVYFYALITENQYETKKMVLLK